MSFRVGQLTCTLLIVISTVACSGPKKHPPQDQTIQFATQGLVSGAVGTTVSNQASGGGGNGEITYSSSNLSVASVNPISGVATLLTVGTTTITATKAASAGFNQTSASYSLAVTPGTQTISFAQPGPLQVQVGSVVSNAASGGAGSGAIAYATSNSSIAVVNPLSGTVTVTGVGTATITATKAADTNYQQAQTAYVLDVTPASQTIAFAQPGPVQAIVGESINNLASGGNGTGAISYATSNAMVAMVNVLSGQVTLIGSGSATITATKAADANYLQAQSTYVVIVTPGVQTIAFAQTGPLSMMVGESSTNTASGGSGSGAISYATSDNAVATVNPTTGAVNALGTGSATITAIKAADANYQQAQATYTVNVSLGTQTIAFAQPGPLQSLLGAVVNNPASGGAGTGAITYGSSDPAVIAVNSSTGVVTPLTTGSATITATKAADANYQSAQATYTITVVATAAVNAWVGESDSLVTLPAVANGARFTRSGDRNCSLSNYAVCTRGQQSIVAGVPATAIVDTAATAGLTGYYWLQTDTRDSTALPMNVDRFSKRVGHAALFFDNRYWVIGGSFNGSANAKADVWSSLDGRTWELELGSAPFGARWFHQAVVYGGKMWVIGGINSAGGLANSVWSSSDGVNWMMVAATTPFNMNHELMAATVFQDEIWVVFNGSAYSTNDGIVWTLRTPTPVVAGGERRGHASLLVFNGQLWYVGGAEGYTNGQSGNNGVATNSVWNSDDGITWTEVTASADFAPRTQQSAFVLNNRLWVFGGRGVSSGTFADPLRDAWSTADGVTWTPEATGTEIDQIFLAGAVQETDRVTLIAGILRGWSAKVHQSTDGNNWDELSHFAQFSPRLGARAVSFLGDMWIIGGATLNELDTNDVWRSSDGVNWSRVTTSTPIFSARDNHQVLVFNNRLWVIGGWGNTTSVGGDGVRLNDVWSSADGVTWREETANAGFAPRISFAAAVFNAGAGDRMWVIGGETATDTFVNDVWSSDDGINWIEEVSSADFSARGGHSVVAFGGNLWLFAGGNVGYADSNVAGTLTDEVWQSPDGRAWTPVGAGSRFAARYRQEALVHDGRMWVIGGSDAISVTNEVWWTSDGINWTQAMSAAKFSPRTSFSAVVHDNEIWVLTGYDSDRFNDVWRTSDGVDWRVAVRGVIQMQ